MPCCPHETSIVFDWLDIDESKYKVYYRIKLQAEFFCSPSLVRHPDGQLLASMDLFEGKSAQNLTLIYRSDDEGKTRKYVSELFPCT